MANDELQPDSRSRPPDEPTASDHSLLRRFRQGDEGAATALYIRYAKRLEALARAQTGQQLATRFEPEDVVQSVFRTFFRRAVDSGYEVPAGDELWQLLLVLALNKIRSLAAYHHAQKRDVGRTSAPPADQTWSPEAKQGEDLAYQSLRLVVEELVAALPAPQDRIVELRIEGHEVQEIANQVGRSNRTVERTLQQFRKQLAKLIDGHTQD